MASRRTSRWTIGFDAWGGVPVRVHLLMVLFAITVLAASYGQDLQQAGLVMIGVLSASVVLHEAAHCLAAVRLGGVVDEVVLTPIGGLRAPRVPDEPEPQVFVALVGPMTNLALVVLATAALGLVSARESQILPLFSPVSPSGLVTGSLPVVALKMTLWINSTLFLLNLIPAFPFDGGPALRAILWPMLGRRSAAVATAQAARLVAGGLLVAAVVTHKAEPLAVMPLWAPLVTLAVFVLFSAQHDLALAGSMDAGGDAWRATPGDGSDDAPVSGWLDEDEMVLVEHGGETRRRRREAQELADEAYEDARVDDILARLHDGGLDKLTDEERRVLERASQRYRQRSTDGEADDP